MRDEKQGHMNFGFWESTLWTVGKAHKTARTSKDGGGSDIFHGDTNKYLS